MPRGAFQKYLAVESKICKIIKQVLHRVDDIFILFPVISIGIGVASISASNLSLYIFSNYFIIIDFLHNGQFNEPDFIYVS